MIVTVKTESGSVYRLNSDEMTWERLVESKYKVRGTSGNLFDWPEITIGQPLNLFCPPCLENPIIPDITPVARLIVTSPVAKILQSNFNKN